MSSNTFWLAQDIVRTLFPLRERGIYSFSMATLFQHDASAGFRVASHNESKRFDVKTASTDRRCFANPGGDHSSAIAWLVDCSSPKDKSSKLAGSCKGHSS